MAPSSELGIDTALGPRVLDLAVERGEALLGHFPLVRPPNLDLEARPKLSVASSWAAGGGPGRCRRDPIAVPALAADAADDDVRVRVLGIMVVDRRPLDGPARSDSTRHQPRT